MRCPSLLIIVSAISPSASHLYVASASDSTYTPEFQMSVLPSISCTPLNIVQNIRDGSRRQQSVLKHSWNVLYPAGDDKRLNYAENWITSGSSNKSVHVRLGGGRGGQTAACLMIDDTERFAFCRIASICDVTSPLLLPDLTPFPVIMQGCS
jgi:hypothetical protein